MKLTKIKNISDFIIYAETLLGFKSRLNLHKEKTETTQMDYFGFLVRVTGLEPVRRATHAPQTCLSASSSTLAFATLIYYHKAFYLSTVNFTFFKNFVKQF